MNKVQRLAAAVSDPAANYGPESASYSPKYADLAPVGLSAKGTQPDAPNSATEDRITVAVPAPPNPALGGQPGIAKSFGYSTGLRPTRHMHQPFDGRVLMVPTMGVHSADGPVGFSNRTGRLAAGVAAAVNQWLPAQQEINESFTMPASRNSNPLDRS